MSALSSLLSSIDGTGGSNSSTLKPKPVPLKPLVTNGSVKSQSKSAPATPTVASQSKPEYKGTANLASGTQQSNTLKRKAEEIPPDRPVKLCKPNTNDSSDGASQKSRSQGGESRPIAPLKSKITSSPVQSVPKPAKPPAKGSYAEMMARAKEAATTKTSSQVGLIRHQPTEKLKASKLADRRKGENEKGKAGVIANNGNKAVINGKTDSRRRSISPTTSTKKTHSIAPKAPKPSLPPLHAPTQQQRPTYKGTLGQGSKRAREDLQRKKSKYDDYLGTDEEEEDDYGSYGEDEDQGGYSDASSDMEGGFDDLELEERRALQAAKEDDARELALENKLKQEKLERQKKLAALAAKRK